MSTRSNYLLHSAHTTGLTIPCYDYLFAVISFLLSIYLHSDLSKIDISRHNTPCFKILHNVARIESQGPVEKGWCPIPNTPQCVEKVTHTQKWEQNVEPKSSKLCHLFQSRHVILATVPPIPLTLLPTARNCHMQSPYCIPSTRESL